MVEANIRKAFCEERSFMTKEELIPEASEGEHSNIGTIGFAVGFLIMMILDVALG